MNESEFVKELIKQQEKIAERMEAAVLAAKEYQEARLAAESMKAEEIQALKILIEGSSDGHIIGIFQKISAIDKKIDLASINSQREMQGVSDRVQKIELLLDKIDTFKTWSFRVFVALGGIATFIVTIGHKIKEAFK